MNPTKKFRKALAIKFDVKIKPLYVQIRQLKADVIKTGDSAVTKLIESKNVEEGAKARKNFSFLFKNLQTLMNAAENELDTFESFNIFIRVAFRKFYGKEFAEWLFDSVCDDRFKDKVFATRGKYKVWHRIKDLI